MKLIDDWHKSLRLYSQRINAAGVALSVTYGSMYGQLKETISPETMAYITGAVFAIGFIGRIISQSPAGEEK